MFASRIAIVFALCILLSIESVFSVEQCYKCDSRDDFECASSPKQAKFIHDCSNSRTQNLPGDSDVSNRKGNRSNVEYVCKKLVWLTRSDLNKTSTKVMTRGCAHRGSCYVPLRITSVLESCDECGTGLCNSSSMVSAGFYSFIIFITMFLYFGNK